MEYRNFGNTGLKVSKIGFGAWGIGGASYGPVSRSDALAALHQAEELGCNLVDTAAVYGESESIIGEFLTARRDKWVLASKYSGQEAGLMVTLEQQLKRLQTDTIDFYQIHWLPHNPEDTLFREMERAKAEGKIRYFGVSLYTANDIQFVLNSKPLDAFQVKLSLLDPLPYTTVCNKVSESGAGVLIRSSLREGLLTGKFASGVPIKDTAQQRSELGRRQMLSILKDIKKLEPLLPEGVSLHELAVRYAMSFEGVSSVLLGCKNASQAKQNMLVGTQPSLPKPLLQQIAQLQLKLGLLGGWRGRMRDLRDKIIG